MLSFSDVEVPRQQTDRRPAFSLLAALLVPAPSASFGEKVMEPGGERAVRRPQSGGDSDFPIQDKPVTGEGFLEL